MKKKDLYASMLICCVGGSLATIAAKPRVGNRELYGKEEAVTEQQQDGATVGGKESSLTISFEL